MKVTDEQTVDTYYQALLERDASFVGIFYVGVKTTSIFCIATCRARKPKFENVEFYTTIKEVLQNGYRPCKVCKPTENTNETPVQVENAIQLVKSNLKKKITDGILRENDISPEYVRRWFKKNYDITFQAYQRMYRINHAYQELKAGGSATATAFESGYDSLSGFGYTFKKLLGKSPINSHGENIILIHRFATPLGAMFVCATEEGVCLLEFTDRRMLETEFRDLQKRLNAQILVGENEHTKQTQREINDYFLGKRTQFEVSLVMPGTDFQVMVWNELLKIPYGKTISYQQQSINLEKPKAIRAVATANGCNRIAIIIPCHRVVGKNGELTGYAGGLERKRWLIQHEKGEKELKLLL